MATKTMKDFTEKQKYDIRFVTKNNAGDDVTVTVTNVTIDTSREDAFKGGEGTYLPVVFKSTEDSTVTMA